MTLGLENNHLVTAPRLLYPSQAAKYLAIGTRKLWSLTNSGEIRCVRIGKAVRYALEDLDEWVDEKRPPRRSFR